MENGVRYLVNVEDGQKTGFFLVLYPFRNNSFHL